MSVDLRFEPALNLVVLTFRGAVTLSDHLSALHACARDPRYNRAQSGLVDLERCSLNNHFFDEVQVLARTFRKLFGEGPSDGIWSVHAPGDVVYGIGRMLQSVLDGTGRRVAVSRTRGEALDAIPLDRTTREYGDFRARWLFRWGLAA